MPDAEFEAAERALGIALPGAWRRHLQKASWLRRGWLSETCYLHLHRPSESLSRAQARQPFAASHPGILFIGDDGAGEHLAVDLREARPRVMAVPNVSSGWTDAIEQTASLDDFLAQVDAGSFNFRF
ncbi:MAG TPA: SMI1/KNR4 family protein [Planctomycetota bacterium]|nr:SMI1/KNR4 family protein [Planctomycetota bacterium]